MTQTNKLDAVRTHLTEVVAAHNLMIEDLRWFTGKERRLVITVDLDTEPGSVDSQVLEDVSREISARLDDFQGLDGSYTLEISTPGAERELTEARHFLRARGRLVSFALRNGTSFTGRIVSVDGDTVELTDSEKQNVEKADIQTARVLLEFKR